MKLAIWIIFIVLAALWSGLAALVLGFTDWLAQFLASGGGAGMADAVRAAAQWSVPGWIAFWIDPGLVKALQDAVLWSIDTLGGWLPQAGVVVGWMAPLVWLGWGVGLIGLLGLAIAAHWYAAHRRGRTPQPAGAR